ncbi:concanavalin A-like lectin/glucanase domain-containing protein [Ilyonectria robusta]|uniref:concanavalin A-like lectin/glucanase domain-containing protein n=1 Tax=Ilyonectria robusta TaxID=1079257 RepID=UPI001E8E7C93|nr:concanavalin A-like lectin/glucanase domain-containing protein [Ilyonectria robusta]KAH8699560.1 concanavalin A-like lectin/glucanase domain-containing protein [Ilyonectria robusta]
MLMTADPADGSAQNDEEIFFIPSYLAGSTYVQKLEEAHRSKLQARESTRTSASGLSPSLTTFNPNQHPLPPGSHRGMSHTVIERPPVFEEDESLAPLPSKWNKDDQWGGIEIQPDGLSIKYVGPKNQHDRDHEACAVRADHYMPLQCGVYYYEVQILSAKRDDATIGIGFSTKTATLSRPIGWEPEAWGYHGDDGRCFTGQNIGRHYGPRYNTGDVIGCGVNFRNYTAFFTKNGVKIGTAFHDVIRGKLHPAISLKKPGEYIRANFGQSPFVYNIDDLMREEREKVQKEIEATETSTLVPGMNETDLIQALVLQFLQHDGYVETARAFAQDMKVQKEALNIDPNVKVDGLNIRDDEDANNRQRIRKAILEGDIDRALKYTNAYYPHVLQDNEHVDFRLRCRRFIEMVRKAAQLNMLNDSKKSNGHATEAPHDMDLDMNGSESTVWATLGADAVENSAELAELERTMLEYGQSLQAKYRDDPRKEVEKALNEIWALVAYRNPLKEPQVSHLLDRKGRVAVAEELNSAILLSLGKSSRASLEKLYAQTSVLLEDLRQDGGEGAFVSVDDAMEDIPRSTQI